MKNILIILFFIPFIGNSQVVSMTDSSGFLIFINPLTGAKLNLALTTPSALPTPGATSNTTTFATTAFVRTYSQPLYATTTALTPGTTVSWVPTVGTNIYTLTPAQAETINMGTIPAGCVGQYMILDITTSGTSAFVLTAGTNLKMQGTLSTGTVTAKRFILKFLIETTTSVLEISRTTAM